MKKILVTRSSMPTLDEYVEEIKCLWDTHWLTNMGVKHQTLENELTKYLNVESISLFTNGHLALELALQALNLNGEVITTPFTFASTTHAIIRNGLTPVFCDIDLDTYTIDTNKLEALITDKTCAIVPVHVYGNICNVEEIERISKKYNLKVIYDAAHAFGIKYKGRGIANFGDISMFSFHATKVFNSIEGGAIVYHKDDFGDKLYQLKNFGIKSEVEVVSVGSNAKMNEFQAAMGICNLRHLDEEIKKREIIFKEYQKGLAGLEGICIPKLQKDVVPNFAYYPIVVDCEKFGCTRDEISDCLKENNIYARKYFYPLTSSFECFENKFGANITPVALEVSKRVLTLPMYADLELAEVKRICDIISKCRK